MSNLDQLNTAKANILNILTEITANPKPTYNLDGVSIPWTEYHQMLVTQLNTLNDLIVVESGPFVYVTAGVS